MQKLAELCVRRPVFATVLILALVVVGFFAYFQLGVDRFPNVDFPFVAITTTLPGAAPEEIETEVTDKIEEAVNTDQRHRGADLDLVGKRVADAASSSPWRRTATWRPRRCATRSTASSPTCPRTPIRRSSRRSTPTPTR